jgi:hypothetical protein
MTPTTDISRAERVLKGIAKWLDADKTMTSDQIMRLPWTQNTKPRNQGAICSVLVESQCEYDLGDFLPYEILMTSIQAKLRQQNLARMTRRSPSQSQQSALHQSLNTNLAQAILAELERCYGAVPRGNGWYACYCPFGHQQDCYPGDHAYFHPDKGLLNCFGHHGQHLMHSIAMQINMDVNHYGGIYTNDN